MRIEWLSSAENDADGIVDYLDPLNPDAARRMVMRIQLAIERLRSNPFVGRRGREFGTRELVVHRTPYIVVYDVQDDCVLLHHIFHTSRQWPPEAP